MDQRFTRYTVIVLILGAFYSLDAQIGGRYAYEFLGQPVSARITALGSSVIGVSSEADVNLAWANPASLNENMHQQIVFNHNFHLAGVSNGHAGYGHYINKFNLTTHMSVSYINYGDFVSADEFGNRLGTFNGRETALTLGAARKIQDRIQVGANIKLVSSSFDDLSSLGIATDLGVIYHPDDQFATMSFVIKNLGGQLTSYSNERRASPLDIQIGYTKRLQHLPFRFAIIAHQLQKWNIRYDDPDRGNTTDIFGVEETRSALELGVENFFRHMIFNGEFLIGKKENFNLRVGYNHLRRRELAVSEFRSLSGFSFGIGFKINRFKLDYGLGYYHLAGSANHLSISTNISEFKKKKIE